MIFLKTRGIDSIEEINIILLDEVINRFNDLDDLEFQDVIMGYRGNLRANRSETISSFKVDDIAEKIFDLKKKKRDETCELGDIENVPCQYLPENNICKGINCEHYQPFKEVL